MEIALALFVNRVSAVEENKEEISLDVFLQVYWQDPRIRIIDNKTDQLELAWDKDHKFWVPDLYIRQLREMRVLSVFQEMAAIRLYRNSTLRISIGATIILKCDMDFRLYPLDVQTCGVDFSSYKYSASDMTFRWKDDSPLRFPSDFADGCRLPRYVVSFEAQQNPHTIYYGESNHSAARLTITLSREIRSHLLESYLPSTLFVIMSWGSFVVMPEVVPGRMVLLVTTLLSLVTMFDTVRNNSPNALELKCIEVWIISCTLFVFLALMEYFIVLFGMRYDKHWRHPKQEFDSKSNTLNNLSLYGNQRVAPVENNIIIQNKDVPNPINIATTLNKDKNHTKARLQLRLLTHHAILYCGSQRGVLDRISLTLFPLCFFIFCLIYWFSYLSEAQRIKL
ncbi:glycine receptor subunit alpha-2-like isoform X2 [Planococcus citri]